MENKIELQPITDIQQQKEVLSQQEWDLWQLVLPQAGTVVLKGPPGGGKTAIWTSIAKKLRFQFFDFALTHLDSADLGGLPVLNKNNDGISVSTYAVNDWAIESNKRPTIIFLDEINRPSDDIINALLKVLDKRLGLNYVLNDNVYIVAAGNLGMSEDGTTVSALDSAMNNRIIHQTFNPTLSDWIEYYAQYNVHPVVVSFLQTDEGHEHYRKRIHDADAYTTPRSWTHLSDFLLFHKYTDLKVIKEEVSKHAIKYIGNHSATAFVTYLVSLTSTPIPSMSEIVSKGKSLKRELQELNLAQKAYIVNSYTISILQNVKAKQIKTFIELLPEDLIALMYSRIITAAITISTDSVVDPTKTSYTVNQVINPYLNVLNVNRTISEKLLQSY